VQAGKSVILPITFAIGFTGHRRISGKETARVAVRKFLAAQQAESLARIYGVTSVAAGADLIFAETCLELGIPLRVLLPFPPEEFRKDFDEPTWQRAEYAMAQALSVDVVGTDSSRDARYYECGVETVQQSKLLLALWDGKPANGLGGTEDIVSFARDQGRPVIWIHSESGAVQKYNYGPEVHRDAELEFLNGLPEASHPSTATAPVELARAWFAKIDENATHAAPKLRRLAAIPILCTAGASIMSGVGSFAGGGQAWLAFGTAAGFLTGALPAMIRLHSRQVLWARIRSAAEICRSYLALWKAPGAYDVIGPEVVPELTGMLMSLDFLRISDPQSRQGDLDDFRKHYRDERVRGQISYFEKNALKAGREGSFFHLTITISIIIALAANLMLLFGPHWLRPVGQGNWKLTIGLSGVIFFQLATVAGALVVVNDCERRRVRYRELHHLLEEWDKQLELARTWPVLLRIATKIEKALLAEVIEWRSLARHSKLPRR
jgi:hypothetical protein